MAKAKPRPYKENFKDFWPVIRRHLPALAMYFAFAFSADHILYGLAYFWLRTFLFDPDGVLAWSAFVLFSFAQAYLLGSSFIRNMKLQAPVRQARKAYNAYEPGAEAFLRTAKANVRKRMSLIPVFFAPMLLFLAMTPLASLIVWRDLQAPLVQSPKHPRAYSPRKELQRVLGNIEKRGIFTRPNLDQ